ncbi:2Fe-2S iron-sulfur cluster-binding protein [Haliangium sp.]|uniref:2Fe-2S iron-sulfur cluster-binding protein n=1 Tax=Haliangium sp. TaxID=2663208 RepID=UPI003D0E68D0
MPTVTFLPAGTRVSYDDGETLFEVGQRAGIDIDTACVGKGTCGLCRVRIVSGEGFLSPYSEEERKHLGNVYHLTQVRLSCRSVAAGGDVVVDLAVRRPRRKQGRSPR